LGKSEKGWFGVFGDPGFGNTGHRGEQKKGQEKAIEQERRERDERSILFMGVCVRGGRQAKELKLLYRPGSGFRRQEELPTVNDPNASQLNSSQLKSDQVKSKV
jgi:hypothetical protein